jgi:phosphohistidine phosphatase
MRTLYLLRHAKSGWDDPDLADIDRPLNDRGRRAATALAEHLRGSSARPQLVFCSPARRTRETLDLIAPGLGLGTTVVIDPVLYGADAALLWDKVRELPADADEVLIIGHNPGLHELAASLAGPSAKATTADEKVRSRLRAKLPTGSFVTVDWAGSSWADLHRSAAVLRGFIPPRDLEPRD